MLRQMIGLALLVSLAPLATAELASATDLPVVDSAALGMGRSIPWSEPVQVNDPFEGSFVGVFDRNYFYDRVLNRSARVEVQSLWSRDSVRFLLVARDQDCLGGRVHYGFPSRNCSDVNAARNIAELFVKIDDQVFQVSGQNSTFSIGNELAQALQNAPAGNISIRLVTDSGEAIDSEIGEGTVAAWKTVYLN